LRRKRLHLPFGHPDRTGLEEGVGVLGFVGHGLQKRTRKEIEERVGFEHSRRDEEIGRGKKESEDEPCTPDPSS